ncbi:MAG: hypothetical protein PHF86_15060 [Candidatus Nanoarchaeia archaeon]|jgi:hypothetical protein|nr:hypothetical protein [Candidatus Nanoarchaeia archaeon]
MSKFTTFYEKFAKGVKSQYGYSELYINPNIADRDEMVGTDIFASFRGIIDPKGNLYVWIDKAALHDEVLEDLGLYNNYKAIPIYIYPDDKYNVIISYWSRQTASNEDKKSYKDRVLNNKYLKDFLNKPISIKETNPLKSDKDIFTPLSKETVHERMAFKKKMLGDKNETKLFIDPTDREIQYLLQIDNRGIRGGIDQNGIVHVWKLDTNPKKIQQEFKLHFIADVMWDANNKEEANIKLLDPSWKANTVNEDLLKKIDYGMVNAFSFLKSYNITDYAGKNIITREV